MNSGNTAIKRNKPSKPLTDFMHDRQIMFPNGFHISYYDHGCGKGDDLKWLLNNGYLADGWDPIYSPKKPNIKKRDVVLCNYVINVINNKLERIECIKEAWSRVRVDGLFLLSTRTDKEINKLAVKNNWKKYKDGYITSKNTFQKGFSLKELAQLILDSIDDIDKVVIREDKKSSYSAIYVVKNNLGVK